ncbi:MAG: hypothetical protein DRJ40_08760 [Thermoprotei archaeon]|nr:MAG: hypothetical protein DRJ40_08760 [Thermoprotei archaeon]
MRESEVEVLKSKLQRMIKMEVDNLLKSSIPNVLKFTRVGITGSSPTSLTVYVKIFHSGKVPVSTLFRVVELLKKYSRELYIDSPHAGAIRISGPISRDSLTKVQLS